MNYKDKTVFVYDQGLFVDVATRLTKDFGRVLYYYPWESPFPKSNVRLVGQGIPGVEVVSSPWNHLDEVDLWVFPDVNAGPLQTYLASIGKRVWGSRMGEELELEREDSKRYLKALGLAIGNWKSITGMDALRAHLKTHQNQWVKVSTTRGDFETFQSKNYSLIEPKLDELEHTLGPKKSVMKFVVEDSIGPAVEIGYDGYCIDGVFPNSACIGIEVKDKGYLGHFVPQGRMPKQINLINSTLSETMRKFQYRNFFAAEARITADGTPWVIDPCCRQGSPPSELLQLLYSNFSDILWHGAEGVCVDPKPAGLWGAELLIHSAWADKNWQAVSFPKEFRDNIRFRNLTVLDGKYYIIPQAVGLPEIGAVSAVGATPHEAINRCKEIAGKIEGYFIEVYAEALDEAFEEMAKLKKFGITL